jgi:hypothetical protein
MTARNKTSIGPSLHEKVWRESIFNTLSAHTVRTHNVAGTGRDSPIRLKTGIEGGEQDIHKSHSRVPNLTCTNYTSAVDI